MSQVKGLLERQPTVTLATVNLATETALVRVVLPGCDSGADSTPRRLQELGEQLAMVSASGVAGHECSCRGSSGWLCQPMGQPGGCPTSLAQPDALCWQLAGFVCVRISACTKHLREDMCSRCGCLCCDAQARTSSSLHSSLVLLVLLAAFEIMLRLCCNMH